MTAYNIIKVNATKSTNDKVKMLIKSKKINNKDVISAKYQYKGRGQLARRWFSSYGNNLLCSLYLEFTRDFNSPIYALNFATSLSVLKTVNFFTGRSDFIESSSLRRFGSQYIKVISNDPLLIDIENQNGPASDIQLNAILKRKDDSYLVISNKSINIDPIDLKSIHLSVVSQDTVGSDWSYRITFKDGKRGTDANMPIAFKLTSAFPNPFNDKISFNLTVLNETEIEIKIYDIY